MLIIGTLGFLAAVGFTIGEQVNSTELDMSPHNTVFTAHLGDNVSLPCNVRNLDKYKIMWFGPIGVARLMYYPDNMTGMETEVALHIQHIQSDDGGVYKCLVTTRPIQFLKMRLEVLVPPSIDKRTSSHNMVAIHGSNVSLMCDVTGNPKPSVSWVFVSKDGHQSDLFENTTSSPLSISNVSLSDAGIYICNASNGVGHPVIHKISVEVITIEVRSSCSALYQQFMVPLALTVAVSVQL